MKITVAITGASGSIVGLRLIEELKRYSDVKVKTIISDAGKKVLKLEENKEVDFDYSEKDLEADICSSSQSSDVVVVCPCSMKTLSAVANGYTDNLIVRAADNCLRMRKKLILCTRETPLSLPHIENMKKAHMAGAIVMPLNIAYYYKPKTVDEITNFFVGKILDLLGLEHKLYEKWKGDENEFQKILGKFR